MIAICGLDCSECDIGLASTDEKLAEKIARAMSRGGTEVRPEQIKCGGCRGTREDHWSSNCHMLNCCVDERGLNSCGECPEFPCSHLDKWAAGGDRYAAALERLRGLRAGDSG
jgi:hypothetical protein